MTRIFLQAVLPLLAPTLLYWAWRAFARYQATKKGEEPHGFWEKAPYFWLTIVGLVLMMISLGSLALLSGAAPDTTYHPPVMRPDGTIQPGYHD